MTGGLSRSLAGTSHRRSGRIGEVAGVRKGDIDRDRWIWTVRRQTTPGPGGLIDKATKGKRARKVPIIEEARELVARRLDAVGEADARLFTGPRGGRNSEPASRPPTTTLMLWRNVEE